MLEDVQRALQLIPDEAERYYGLALMGVMLGRFNESISNLERVIQANPDHIAGMALLGEPHLKLGEHRKAAALLEQVVSREIEKMIAITWPCLAYHSLGYKGKAQLQQSILPSVAPDLVVSVLNK
jgi:tetratricopeptide (TPR) repeat protein